MSSRSARGSALLPSLAACALALGWATASAATSTPNAVYTLDAPVAFSILGASGTVDAYDPGTEGVLGPLYASDTICLDGGCGDPNDFSNQDWILVRVTVTSGSIDEVGLGALFEASNGLGYFTSLGGAAPTGGDSTTNPNTPEWSFASLTGSSAPLFVVFDAGDLPTPGGPFGLGATNFDLRVGGSSDQVQGHVTTLIPEPSTGLLLGFSLLGLGHLRRRA